MAATMLCIINMLKAQSSYCSSMPISKNGRDIENIQFGALNHISNCSTKAPTPNSLLNQYSDYTSFPTSTFYRGKKYRFYVSVILCNSTTNNTNSTILTYIDYNQDGDFNDTGELVYYFPTLTGSYNPTYVSDSIEIPYTAALGNTRLRIVLKDSASADTCCGLYSTGETEDYTINIDSMPLYYNYCAAIQQKDSAAAGNVNVPILKIPVSVTNGGGFAVASTFEFNTIGTTNTSDIVNAKLFFTGTRREFDVTKLSASIANPAGTMVFNVNDTLINSDTNFFWLVYDVANNAAINHELDAQFTNLTLIGINHIPTNGNPLGSVLIDTAMTLISTTTTQALFTKMYLGTINNMILGIEINTSLKGVPIKLSSLNISTNGTSNLSVISNLKIWNTGNDPVFNTVNQFGNTISVPNATQTITSDVKLKPGTNYFWVTYDIVPHSQMNICLDAECSSLIIQNQIIIPSITSPTGYGKTDAWYCSPVIYWNTNLEIDSIKFGNLSYNHFAGNRNYYTDNNGVNHPEPLADFTNLPPKTFLKGNSYPLDVTLFYPTVNQFAIAAYIDYNQDGDYDDAGEEIYNSKKSVLPPTKVVHCGNINIPYSAIDGKTHLRVICGWQPNNWNIDPCFSYDGEAWDFPIIISDPSIFANYTSSYALQQTVISTKGKTNVKILNLPITSTPGNGDAIATSFVFNTVGTSNANDITSAKLYTTGNNNKFNTSNLLGSITSPSGSMVFYVNDTLLQYDTTFYWLTYDVSTNATINHVLDASFDGVQVNGVYYTPSVTNPIGNVLIDTSLIILNANTTQNLLTKVYTGVINNKILGIELNTYVKVSSSQMLNFNVSTNGTANLSDVNNLKIWFTGNSPVFNTNRQLGATISNPLAINNVSDTITLLNGINYFWLSFDVPPTATIGNAVDAGFNFVTVNNTATTIPTVTNPTGNAIIDTALIILGANTSQNIRTKVYTGSANNQIIGIELNTIVRYSKFQSISLNISTSGTTNLNEIINLKVWSTGNSPIFDTTNQFGSTIPILSASNNVSGNLSLSNGTNYFWVTYDISPTATINNYVDATCNYISVNTVNYIPSTSPVGNRQIRTFYYYCSSSANNSGTQEIYNVKFGNLNNSSTCTSIAPGPNSISQKYSDYTSLSAVTFIKGMSYPLSITTNSCAGFANEVVAVYVDYNQDGIFNGINENIYTSTYALGSNQIKNAGNISIPLTAANGEVLLRVVYADSSIAPSCGNYQNGETEDYTINIQDPAIYTWNQSTAGDYALSSNWSPSRVSPASTDKLIFNLGGNAIVSNVPSQSVSGITLQNNTNLKLRASSSNLLTIIDSLNLTSGNIINDSNVIIQLGQDTVSIGSITGTGNIQGTELRRWVNKINTVYNFPLYVGTYNRSIKITYTVAPVTQGILMAKFVESPPGNVGLPLTQGTIAVNKAGVNGYWNLTTNKLNSGLYKATVNAEGFSNITDYSKLVLLKRSISTGPWTLAGSHFTTTGSNSSPILNRSSISGFGNFGIGGDSMVNPLPVGFIDIKAKPQGDDVQIEWQTSTEINNLGFEVERSENANDYDKIDFVKGNINSNSLQTYRALDRGILSTTQVNTLYYRLKQIDIDGNYSFSKIVSIDLNKKVDDEGIKLYPNPFENLVKISLTATTEQIINIKVYDMLGQELIEEEVMVSKGQGVYNLSKMGNLANGLYLFKVKYDNRSNAVLMEK